MTDQGYPPPGDPAGQQPQYPGQPDYGQQPQYPQQPQQPQYPGQQPQYPPQPQYPGQPGYGQPDPNQPGYGPPPPGYPPPGYGGPGGPTGPGGPGGPGPAGGGGSRKGLWAAIGAVVLVAAVVVAYLLLSGGSSASASTPKEAVKKLLEAGKSNDVNAAKKVLCKADNKLGMATKLGSTTRVLSYTIGKTSKTNGITTVQATVTTLQSPTPQTEQVPVVKEGGSWKVCFSKELSLLPTSGPTQVPTEYRLPH